MRHIRSLLTLLAGLSALTAMAQQPGSRSQDKPLRIEIQAKSVNETYRVIPCGDRGIVLFFRSLEIADDARVKWYFSLYDTNLQVLWTRSLPMLNELEFRAQQVDIDTLSLLFLPSGKSRGQVNEFEILRVALNRGTMVVNKGKLQQEGEATGFGIRKGRCWMGFNIKGQSGNISNILLGSGTEHTFQLGQGSQIAIRWMEPDTTGGTVSAIVCRTVSKKTLEHFLVCYDTTGVIRHEVPVGTQDFFRDLNHVLVTSPNPGANLLLGSFGQYVANPGPKNKVTEMSTGFFTSLVEGTAQKSCRFFNFLEMPNTSGMLNEHDINELKKKALKKNRPLNEYSLDLSLLLHSVLSWNEQYVVTAEVYTPQYHTENYTDFDYYGRPYTNSFSVFDGYRFYNTILAGFDHAGNLLWNNTFEIRNLLSMELTPKVVTFPSGNDLLLCYLSDGMVGTRIIRGNDVVEKNDFAQIDLLSPNDKLLSESKGKIMHWYGDFFIASGYQEIKNIAATANNRRLVYYFSKLRFEK